MSGGDGGCCVKAGSDLPWSTASGCNCSNPSTSFPRRMLATIIRPPTNATTSVPCCQRDFRFCREDSPRRKSRPMGFLGWLVSLWDGWMDGWTDPHTVGGPFENEKERSDSWWNWRWWGDDGNTSTTKDGSQYPSMEMLVPIRSRTVGDRRPSDPEGLGILLGSTESEERAKAGPWKCPVRPHVLYCRRTDRSAQTHPG